MNGQQKTAICFCLMAVILAAVGVIYRVDQTDFWSIPLAIASAAAGYVSNGGSPR